MLKKEEGGVVEISFSFFYRARHETCPLSTTPTNTQSLLHWKEECGSSRYFPFPTPPPPLSLSPHLFTLSLDTARATFRAFLPIPDRTERWKAKVGDRRSPRPFFFSASSFSSGSGFFLVPPRRAAKRGRRLATDSPVLPFPPPADPSGSGRKSRKASRETPFSFFPLLTRQLPPSAFPSW